MNERPAVTRRFTNAGRSFSSRDWLSTEPWEPPIPDGQTVPLGGLWERAARRCELRRSVDPTRHAATTRPSGRELLWALGLLALLAVGWWLYWLVAT
jgi:hypothetical protein